MKHHAKSISRSMEEYARGIAGGLLFSLPMLYTMELWWAGFTASPVRLSVYMFTGLLLLLGYNHFVGLRREHSFWEGLWESVEELGLGLLLTIFVLWVTGRIGSDMSLREITGKLVVASMVVAIGISVGKSQLGNNTREATIEKSSKAPDFFLNQITIAICGAVLVASNVAPTEEIVVMALGTSPFRLLIVAIFSMLLGGAILYYSNFRGSDKWVRTAGGLRDILAGIVIMYAITLITSAFMLWFFGRLDGISLRVMAAEIVILSFPGALGASAGRLLIQS